MLIVSLVSYPPRPKKAVIFWLLSSAAPFLLGVRAAAPFLITPLALALAGAGSFGLADLGVVLVRICVVASVISVVTFAGGKDETVSVGFALLAGSGAVFVSACRFGAFAGPWRKFAMFDLLLALATGTTILAELCPALFTSLLTTSTKSAAPSSLSSTVWGHGLRSACSSADHASLFGSSQARSSSESYWNTTGMRSCKNRSPAFESVVIIVYVYSVSPLSSLRTSHRPAKSNGRPSRRRM